tara:strand:+ start:21395 stop:22210 length:816 start_codon:yes stop_codon:yes gene_type:complete
MKKYLSLILCTIFYCNYYAQHEYKMSLGTFISGDGVASGYIQGNNPNYDNYSGEYSSRVGLDLNLGYGYYINPSLKITSNVSFKQAGFRSNQEMYNQQGLQYNDTGGVVFGPERQVTLDNKINLNYIGASIGITYITNSGFTITGGYSFYTLGSGTLKQEGSIVYPDNPSDNQLIDDDLDLIAYYSYQNFSWNGETTIDSNASWYQRQALGTNVEDYSNSTAGIFWGFGYDWGDFSIDYTYSILENYNSDFRDLSGSSISLGYSKLINSNK